MRQIIIICGLIFILGNSSCSLDYENTGAITPDNVWQDKTMISAFLTDIYGRMLPGWPVNANNTDEGMNGPRDMSSYARGQITVDNQGQGFDYSKIDRINFFLDKIQSTTVLTEVEKKQLKGQALFWRAWDYWGKVFSLGGVPLILTPQDMTDTESLFVPRNTTTECVTQILADLDEAIACLPDTWEGEDYGRIDKGCAMAFKGRVLLQYASPLFNPDNNRLRWQNAYDANLEAVNFLKSVGKGLYEGNFADIWYDEQNKEVVMVNQFYYPDHKFSQASIRPEPLTGGASNANEAILPLLLAYPKIDGTPLELDIDRLATDASYNEQFMTEFYVDRDPRFYATIFFFFLEYPCSDRLIDGAKYWNAWKLLPNEEAETGYQYVTLIFDQLSQGVGGASTGYFQKKGLDYDLTSANREDADVDWIEIRFAEVLMNMGEAANEIGKTDEALQVLYDIRKRAGIQSTDGKYGITAMSQDEIREAYINERFIEFAYEGKRFNDLRRWKRYDILNNLKYRSCLYPVIKDVNNLASFDWTKDMYDPEVRKLFRFDYIECADFDMQYVFNLDLNHWFYPIKKDDLDRNSKLEQNNEWGGTFDPLE